jgi:hypothetical protein
MVYCCTPSVSSWDALDKYWIPKIDEETSTKSETRSKTGSRKVELRGRRRLFHRYFQRGNSPEHLRGNNTRKLIDVVHADPLQREAKAEWNSPLWKLLGAKPLSIDQVLEIQTEAMKRLHLVCLTPTQRVVARFRGMKNIALDTQDLSNIADNAFNIGAMASLDAIAVLGCAFRIAMDSLSLEVGQIYLDALRWALDHFNRRWGSQGAIGAALVKLIEARLLQRPSDSPSPKSLGFKVRKRRHPETKAISPELEGLQRSPLATRETYRAPPIVPLDDVMQEFFRTFEQSYVELREAIVDRLQSTDATLMTTDTLRRKRAKLVDDMLLGALNTHGESATAALRLLSMARLTGGLASILYELFYPDGDLDGEPKRP